MTKTKYLISISISLLMGLAMGLFTNQKAANLEEEKKQIVEVFQQHDYIRQAMKKAERREWSHIHKITNAYNFGLNNGMEKIPKDTIELIIRGVSEVSETNLRMFAFFEAIYRTDSVLVAKLGAEYAP